MSKYRNNRQPCKYFQMFFAFFVGLFIGQILDFTNQCEQQKIEIDDDNYFLIALVLTAPANLERRNVIRETWASLRPKQFNTSEYQRNIIFIPKFQENSFLEQETVEQQKLSLENYDKWLPKYSKQPNIKIPNIKLKVLFSVGVEDLDTSLRDDLIAEKKVYNDLLILEDLKDSYNNLTLKLIKSMNALNRTIPNFKYAMKVDDDSYVKLDLLTFDLIQYDENLKLKKQNDLSLYWGYFNGRANIKKSGQWQEPNYNLCERYLPYALGGGYVLSKNLVKFVAEYGNQLSMFKSEDISMGTWLSPFRKIHRRHDVRFDTAYMPRKCKNYHFVLHKRTVEDMREIHKGNACFSEKKYDENRKPIEYFYDWSQTPMKCCDIRT
jgi:galactosylxylosylprotein 3-beta-galactosyltransferase